MIVYSTPSITIVLVSFEAKDSAPSISAARIDGTSSVDNSASEVCTAGATDGYMSYDIVLVLVFAALARRLIALFAAEAGAEQSSAVLAAAYK